MTGSGYAIGFLSVAVITTDACLEAILFLSRSQNPVEAS
jgi:hypothetical protein